MAFKAGERLANSSSHNEPDYMLRSFMSCAWIGIHSGSVKHPASVKEMEWHSRATPIRAVVDSPFVLPVPPAQVFPGSW